MLLHTKKYTRSLLLMLLFAGIFAACNKDMRVLDKGNTPLGLSVDKSDIELLQKNDASNALTFSWTSGSNYGSNSAISYSLQIDLKGHNFSKALTVAQGKNSLSQTYTVKDLNELLKDNWNVPGDSSVILEARVLDSVWGGTPRVETSDSVNVTVRTYKPVTATLYLIGDATPNGWSADDATPLNATSSAGVFTYQGAFTPGKFKLITTLGSFLPSFNKGADSTKLVYRDSESQPDDQFTITEAGVYSVSVSLLDSTISVEKASLPPYSKLYIIGDAVPVANGWDINNPDSLVNDPTNPFHFMYNNVMKAGEFKFPVYAGQGFSVPFYMPLVNHPALSETGIQLVTSGDDFKWQINNAGAYKISMDLLAMKISIKAFTPYNKIWMVGDAAPSGWNIDNPTPLTQTVGNPYEFSFSGSMNIGDFKFPLAIGNWSCDYFMPYSAGEGLTSTKMQFIAAGGQDLKWHISTAGNYKITINQLYETISIVKL